MHFRYLTFNVIQKLPQNLLRTNCYPIANDEPY